MRKIIGYCRVSAKTQIEGNSFEEQEAKILERYSNAIVYKEQFTGTKVDRPIFAKIIQELGTGDVLVVSKLDRFCRTTKEGLGIIDELMGKGVIIHILNMGLIEDTPMGRLIITNLLAFAEFERSMIAERCQSGKAIARTKQGYKEGRPNKFTKEQIDHAMELLQTNSYTEVSKMTQISKATLVREVRKRKSMKGV